MFRDWQIDLANQYSVLIRQSDVVQGEKEIAVHGILPGRERARPEVEVIPEFLEYAGAAVLIAHHAAFDVTMIDRSLKRLGAGRLRNKVIDTGALARRVQRTSAWAPPRAFSLDELARQYNIPLSDRHTAPGDALITALVFLKLLGQLEKRGVRKLKDLLG